jgi:hypothetical protein
MFKIRHKEGGLWALMYGMVLVVAASQQRGLHMYIPGGGGHRERGRSSVNPKYDPWTAAVTNCVWV